MLGVFITGEVIYAKENTAHLTFKRTASGKRKTITYTVQPGDRLLKIIEQQFGTLSPEEKKKIVAQIKRLNPAMGSSQKIYADQKLVLPVPDKSPQAKSTGQAYSTKKGDSVIRIIRREMGIKVADILKTLRLVKQLNPQIKNLDRIYPGQMIRLPGGGSDGDLREVTAAEAEEPQGPAILNIGTKEVSPLPAEKELTLISQVISRMKGSLTMTGFYYIPIPDMGQATIDCSRIPVVELNDGSTILVDFADRIPDSLREMIQANWGNTVAVKVSNKEDVAVILKKTIDASRSYTMNKPGQSVSVGNNLKAQLSLDWLVTQKGSSAMPYMQGLSFIKELAQGMPPAVQLFADRNGLMITDVLDNGILERTGNDQAAAPEVMVLNAGTDAELLAALLPTLGYTPARDAEVKVFEPAKDGFRLSLKADFLVKKGGRQAMFHSRTLPKQFVSVLKEKGTDVVFIGQNDPKKVLLEKVFQVLEMPFASEKFSFKVHSRATIIVPAIKIEKNKKTFYLVDYSVDPDIYGLLHRQSEVNIIQY